MNKILIIEDSKTINNVLKKRLTELGYIVSQAFTYKKAKALLESENFDLIILDLHLPDGEGSELIANIKSLTKTKVVVLTARQDNELREELFQYGILDYIIKDTNLVYSISEITKIIDNLDTKSTKKSRILVIDDAKFICKQVKTILEPRNYSVRYALTAIEGLEKLKKYNFDLLILDMELPDIHGLKLLDILRRDEKYKDFPIVVLSGTSTPEIVRDALKNGASDFLKKPFIFEEFVLKIDLWIDYYKKRQELVYVNENLERLVKEEVEKNQKKDKFLFQQSRQAQMGEMLAMIAHQWRQPLNAISAGITLINNKVKLGKLDVKTAENITTKIHNYIEYLSYTIDDFRNFFKPDKEKRKTDFEKIANRALSLFESSLKSNGIVLEKSVKEIREFLTYENELVHVVVNLLKNAEDVLVSREIKNPKIKIVIDGLKLSVIDNAGGIDKSIKDKIFDPYFSTKSKKDGTGLGLYMSKIIVEEHCGGRVEFVNRKNGACFTIELETNQGEKSE